MVGVDPHELLWQTALTLAPRGDTPPSCGHPLAAVPVETVHKRGLDLPATPREGLLDSLQGAAYHAGRHRDATPRAHGFDHVRLEQRGPGQPFLG
jgi:hypothetical protein